VKRKEEDADEAETDVVLLVSPKHRRDTWTPTAASSATFELLAKSMLLDSMSLSSDDLEHVATVATTQETEEDVFVSSAHCPSLSQRTMVGVAYLVLVLVAVVVAAAAVLAATCCWNPSWHLRYVLLLTLLSSLMYFASVGVYHVIFFASMKLTSDPFVHVGALVQVTKDIDVAPFMTVHAASSFALVAHATLKSDSFEG
jgi:hypothetical protein